MELYEALMTTRSMRRLTDDPPVTDEEIEHCLRAAAQAPSGGNVQPYHFVVITDAEARAAMADLYLRGWRRYRPAMVAALPPFPTAEAEGSFRRSVDLSEHLAEHLADTAERPVLPGVLREHAGRRRGTARRRHAARVGLPGRAELHPRRPRPRPGDDPHDGLPRPQRRGPRGVRPAAPPRSRGAGPDRPATGSLRRRAPQADREDHPLEPLRASAVPSSPRPGRRPTAEPGRQERRTSSSAIWMALSAAPLRRLSLATNSTRPRPSGTDASWRMRPT